MARRARLDAPGQAHLVWQPLLADLPLVSDDGDCRRWCDALREQAALERVAVHAWAVSPASVWLLVTPAERGSLGRLMQGLGRRYAAALNRRHQRAGPRTAGRFRAAVVEPGPWRLDAALWVDSRAQPEAFGSGPARAGLAPRPPWLIDPPELWTLGNTPFERETLWRARLDAGLAPAQGNLLQGAAAGNWVVGSDSFASSLAETFGQRTRPRPRGRPRHNPRLA